LKYYCEEIDAVLEATGSTPSGLTAAAAENRLSETGKNKLVEGKKDSLVKRFLMQLTDPMIIILLAAAAVSAVTAILEGESPAEVFIILAVVIINAVLGVYQESKAEKAIEALQQMAAATSKVLRDGKIAVVKSEDLVVGDVVLLRPATPFPPTGAFWKARALKLKRPR
jgi:Ca2+-transporting ATPase